MGGEESEQDRPLVATESGLYFFSRDAGVAARTGRRARRAPDPGTQHRSRSRHDATWGTGIPFHDLAGVVTPAQPSGHRAGHRVGNQGRRARRLFLGIRRRGGPSRRANAPERAHVDPVSTRSSTPYTIV